MERVWGFNLDSACSQPQLLLLLSLLLLALLWLPPLLLLLPFLLWACARCRAVS